MYEYTTSLISTEVGAAPKYTNGMVSAGRLEIGAAKKLLDSVGNSRFSVVAFGHYLFASCATDEEMEKSLLSCLYFIREVAELEDESIGFMARRIMDAINHYGYVDNPTMEG